MGVTQIVDIAGAYAGVVGAIGGFIGLVGAGVVAVKHKGGFRDEAGFWVTIGATVGAFAGVVLGLPFALTAPRKTP
jgi:hypothetical protein